MGMSWARWMLASAAAHAVWLGLIAVVSVRGQVSIYPANPFRRLQASDCDGSNPAGTTDITSDTYETDGGMVLAVLVNLETSSTVRSFRYWCSAGTDQNLGT